MKQSYTLLLVCFCLSISTLSYAQTVQYPEFSVSIYRYAQDQRYSDHKSIMYLPDLDGTLANNLFPMKASKNPFRKGKENQNEAATSVDSFRISIA